MLKKLFQSFAANTPAVVQDAERIPLAAAVLLLEIAHADGDFQQSEMAVLRTVLKNQFFVSEESLDELLTLAEKTRETSNDLHQFTQEINKAFTQPEKEQIAEALWQLVYADGHLDCYEDALMRQLGYLIGLSHRQLIEAKLKVSRA